MGLLGDPPVQLDYIQLNKQEKKTGFKKVVLKDHNGNRQQMHLSEACRKRIIYSFTFKKFLVTFNSRKQEDPL